MMLYDPTRLDHRQALASALLARLASCGFTEESQPGCNERVFSRTVSHGNASDIRVAIYTSIEGDATREVGEDALRVVAIFRARDGVDRGLAKAQKRVNRVGEIADIVDRMYQRMREVYKIAATSEKCSCGAPKFISRAKNAVCANLCWLTPQDMAARSKAGRTGRRNFRRPALPSTNTAYRSAVPAGAPLPDSWKDAPLIKQVAFLMAAGDTSGAQDWDQWADEMKEN